MDMSEISVRVLDESEWSLYRDIRWRALAESPGSFTAALADEADRGEKFWRDIYKVYFDSAGSNRGGNSSFNVECHRGLRQSGPAPGQAQYP